MLLPEQSAVAGEQGLPMRVEGAAYKVVEIPQSKIDEMAAFIDSMSSAEAKGKYKRILKNLFMGQTIKNANTVANQLAYEIGISSKSIGEIIARQPVNAQTFAMLERLNDIVENAKYMASEPTEHVNRRGIERTDVFETQTLMGGQQGTARMRVNVSKDGNKLYYATNEETKGAPPQPRADQNGRRRGVEEGAPPTDNIPDPEGTVKPVSAEGSVRAAVDRGARGRYNPSAGPEALAMKELARVMERAGDSPASIARATGLQPDGQGGFVPAPTPQTEAGKPGAEHVVQRMLAAGLPEAQQQNAERKAQEQRLEEQGPYSDSLGGTREVVEVYGKTITIDNSLFSPEFMDRQGRTNIQRMSQGLAPIGLDGEFVNIHHVDQTDSGPLIEVLATEHQKNYHALHTNRGQGPSRVNRREFGRWRKLYWEWRSQDFM